MHLKNTRCENMNHGRMVVSIKYCPSCGERFERGTAKKCDDAIHAARRKERSQFCLDCGKNLNR